MAHIAKKKRNSVKKIKKSQSPSVIIEGLFFDSIFNQISDNKILKCKIISFFVERALKCGKKRSKTAILFV
jgi:Na+/H+-dicarboxylate symporter